MTASNIDYSVLKSEVAAFLKEQHSMPRIPMEQVTPAQYRAAVNSSLTKSLINHYPIGQVTDHSINTSVGKTLLRAYTPQITGKLALLVYYHGGGWVAGSVESHDNICRLIAQKSHCIVVSVDYALAPECKYPAVVQQCYEALQWVQRHAKQLGGDEQRIAVAGDSAGGTLATVMTLLARDRQQAWPIIYQALICPVTNLAEFNTVSYTAFAEYDFLHDKIRWFRKHYLNSLVESTEPYASPLLAKNLTGLPAALVVTGNFDVLRDEGLQYAERLQSARVPTRYYCMQGMVHSGAFWMLGSSALAEEIDYVCREIKIYLNS